MLLYAWRCSSSISSSEKEENEFLYKYFDSDFKIQKTDGKSAKIELNHKIYQDEKLPFRFKWF